MLEQFGILNLWIYTLGALMIVLAPGPNTLCVLRTSIVDGRRAAFVGMLAVMIGDSMLILLAYLGIAALLAAHPAVFSAVRIAGGIFLAWLGAKAIWQAFLMRRKGVGAAAAGVEGTRAKRSAHPCRKAFVTALALSLTNPKAILFYVSFFVQFIDPACATPGLAYLILAAILQSFTVMWFSTLITLGADCLRLVARAPALAKLGNTAIGTLFLFFASKLVLDA